MDPQEHSEGGLFAETSDGDDSESDDEFAPTKKGSLFKQQSVETTLDELIDKDETKYNQIIDTSADEAGADDYNYSTTLPSEAEETASVSTTIATQVSAPSSILEPAKPSSTSSKKVKRQGIPGLTKYIFSRDAGGFMTLPSFRVVHEESGEVIYVARRKKMRSPHVYIYRVKGNVGSPPKQIKDSEKIEAVLMASNDLIEYRLVVDDKGHKEIAAAAFDKTNIFSEMVHGFQPRRLSAIVPQMDSGAPIPHNISGGLTSLVQHIRAPDIDDNRVLTVLRTREPVFQDGCYRLNFYGRASVPSVKNFQLVSPRNTSDVLCQFGKFGEDEFHLDIKEPMSLIQAFAIAICQFNNV